ncbi:MAG: MoaD/ThiS family protein [Gammaproteobacteria bacterium]|nr:MoaD/ThiS family protein [Gammaproteobacteria bacterium]
MSITVKYFAVLREQAGKSQEILEFQSGMTVSDVWQSVMNGDLPPDIKVAVNMEYTRSDLGLNDGDEVAFFPSVTGG